MRMKLYFFLPRPFELKGSLAASILVSMSSPSSWLLSSSSPGRRTCILVMVSLLMAEGEGMRLIS